MNHRSSQPPAWAKAALGLLLTAGLAAPALAQTRDAYQVPEGTEGNQAFTGSLGLDFNVVNPIFITHFGVFDDASDGIQGGFFLAADLWRRDDLGTPDGRARRFPSGS